MLVMTSLYFYTVGALFEKPLIPKGGLRVLGQSGICWLANGLVSGLICVSEFLFTCVMLFGTILFKMISISNMEDDILGKNQWSSTLMFIFVLFCLTPLS